ncbi:MAG: cyclic nucleotide-binding domain-containing protein [Chloroflexota bacterium]
MKKSNEIIQMLKKVPLFKGLSDRQFKIMVGSVVTRNYADGEAMVVQGEGGVGIYVIASGTAEAILEMNDGEKKSVNTFGPTDFFGELALLNDGPRTASVYARSDLECLVLTRWDFIPLLKQDGEMAVAILQELAGRFRQTLDALS